MASQPLAMLIEKPEEKIVSFLAWVLIPKIFSIRLDTRALTDTM
jgi:hypothetical protein